VRRVPVFFDPLVLEHDTGPYHPETSGRLEAAVAALKRDGATIVSPPAPERTVKAVQRVHDPPYLAHLAEACARAPEAAHSHTFSLFDSSDNPVSTRSFDAALRTVALTLAAVDEVLAGRASAAFVAGRPPGHHALAARAMGFCFLNAIAIVAKDLIERCGVSRVLVADFDVHHGNGTQEIFWEDGRVGYVSVHRFPFYPGTGAAGERGAGRGLGTTLNVPLPAGSGDMAYAGGFTAALEKIAGRLKPEFVLVSAGFDAHESDPIGGMRVTTRGYGWMTRALEEVAGVFAGGRIVSLLEGGYDPDALGASVVEHVRALAGADLR
jgi:acetoin utilization deacetylase AcuC-like enzyme